MYPPHATPTLSTASLQSSWYGAECLDNLR